MLSSQDAEIIKIWTDKYPSPHTRYCYATDSERLLNYAKKPLSDITLADLQAFAESLTNLGLAPISRVRVLAAAKSLFGFAFRMRHVTINPAAELALPRYEVRLAERILGEEDVQRMLAADIEPRDRNLLQVLYAAGLRVGEVCHLCWRNVRPHGDSGQVTVYGKGGRTRSIVLPTPVWSDLISLRGSAGAEEPVFPSRTGRVLDRGRVRRIVLQTAQAAGIREPISPHWLRHAHASHALDHGAPIHLVQATLGHSSVATTSAYLHARPGDSSARFLATETFLPKSVKSALPLQHTRVMDVMTAAAAAKGDLIMTSNAEEQATTEATAAAPAPTANNPKPKAVKKANAAPRAPRVAPGKAKASKKATPAKKAPKGAKGAKPAKGETGPRNGSKTETIMALLKRPDGATLKEIMKATGWQAHSVRGFVSGTLTKKMDLPVASFKNEAGERAYRIEK
jgi:integrase/recombinase XerD